MACFAAKKCYSVSNIKINMLKNETHTIEDQVRIFFIVFKISSIT
nr:MAG TPA: hypothetical protein [Caudoviricetes sp.]